MSLSFRYYANKGQRILVGSALLCLWSFIFWYWVSLTINRRCQNLTTKLLTETGKWHPL